MTKATAIKNPNGSGWLIDDGSGYSIRYASKREAEATIAKRERIAIERAAYEVERRAARLAAAREYIAARAARPLAPAQFDLFA